MMGHGLGNEVVWHSCLWNVQMFIFLGFAIGNIESMGHVLEHPARNIQLWTLDFRPSTIKFYVRQSSPEEHAQHAQASRSLPTDYPLALISSEPAHVSALESDQNRNKHLSHFKYRTWDSCAKTAGMSIPPTPVFEGICM